MIFDEIFDENLDDVVNLIVEKLLKLIFAVTETRLWAEDREDRDSLICSGDRIWNILLPLDPETI